MSFCRFFCKYGGHDSIQCTATYLEYVRCKAGCAVVSSTVLASCVLASGVVCSSIVVGPTSESRQRVRTTENQLDCVAYFYHAKLSLFEAHYQRTNRYGRHAPCPDSSRHSARIVDRKNSCRWRPHQCPRTRGLSVHRQYSTPDPSRRTTDPLHSHVRTCTTSLPHPL